MYITIVTRVHHLLSQTHSHITNSDVYEGPLSVVVIYGCVVCISLVFLLLVLAMIVYKSSSSDNLIYDEHILAIILFYLHNIVFTI